MSNVFLFVKKLFGCSRTEELIEQFPVHIAVFLQKFRAFFCLFHFLLILFELALQSMNTHGIANFAFELPKAAENKIAISNYFKKQYTVIADTTTEGFMIAGGCSLYIRVKQERADTVEKLKEWLKTHNVTVIYGLAKPIEKDIPQEALTAYKKLHSNYPSTVVQNTEGAGMELSYVADTKNYTDNKIKEAVSAQTQSLANLLSLMPLSTQAAMIETDTNNILDNMEVEK